MKKRMLFKCILVFILAGVIITLTGCPYFFTITIAVHNSTGNMIQAWIDYGENSSTSSQNVLAGATNTFSLSYFNSELYDEIRITVIDFALDRYESIGNIGENDWTIT